MDRRDFIRLLSLSTAMTTLSSLRTFTEGLEEQENTMPVMFIGHGSPMNSIEQNEFSSKWKALGKLYHPKAILCISAHWLTRGTFVTAMPHPQTIHDFGGFPQELFQVEYPAPGNPDLAKQTTGMLTSAKTELNYDWGLDHGTWSILKNMYPAANIPVVQLSIDYSKGGQFHYDLAKELVSLRKKGVLIIGSGNMVHNLGMVAWEKLNEPGYGFDWAHQMNDTFKKDIEGFRDDALIHYEKYGNPGKLAIPTPDHYYPLLYILGLRNRKDPVQFFNDKAVAGSLTMTSAIFG